MNNKYIKGVVPLVSLLVMVLLTGFVYVASSKNFDIRSKAKEITDKVVETTSKIKIPGISPAPEPTKDPLLSPTPLPDPSVLPSPVGEGAYPGAPLCADSGSSHDNSKFHTLWDSTRRCHYDHEHGDNPFTSQISALFPGFDLHSLLHNVGVGHTNPSGATENTLKHGGFKWNVQAAHPEGCQGFEGSNNGVNGSVIQYHGFGDLGIELEASVHSATALLRLCNTSNPTDYGYLYTVQHQSYGQIVVPYQGVVKPYPYYTVPIYNGGFGQYISVDCIGTDPANPRRCRADIAEANRLGLSSTWTSKTTGTNLFSQRPQTSSLLKLLWRSRNNYRAFSWADQDYPYTFLWACSSDNGQTYNPAGCRFNNTTTQVHEVGGIIPSSWDNLAGFDTDSRVGRITANGYTTRYGNLNTSCTAAGVDCHPIKMVNAFVGSYGSVLVYTPGKGTNIVPYEPDRNVFFCNGRSCGERDSGSQPSGWVGQNN